MRSITNDSVIQIHSPSLLRGLVDVLAECALLLQLFF